MKNIFINKKNVIAIAIISFLLILIVVLGAFTPSTKSTDTKRYELSENSNPQGFDSNTLSATPTASNSSIFSSESVAEEHVKKIIKNRNSSYSSISISHKESAYLTPANISQTNWNNTFNKKYGIAIDGTCTLIAIAIMTEPIMQLSSFIEITYPNISNKAELKLAILKELYDISVSFGNNYTISGTYRSTIPKIIKKYFSNHGYNLNVTNNLIESDKTYEVRNDLLDKISAPAILTLDNYYVNNVNQNNAVHSVTVVGGIIYTIEYKEKWYNIKKQTTTLNALIICNGWADSNDGNIGNNLQILIIEDDAKTFLENHITNWQ